MSHPSEDQIRDLAYSLWEQAGRPDGEDKEFWWRAERQLSEPVEDDGGDIVQDPITIAATGGLPTR